MSRRFPATPSLKRKHNKIEPKIEIYILCEGKVTEPKYIKQFSNQYANALVKVHTLPGVGVPLTVVESAIDLKKELLQIAKKTKNSFASAFSVWCIVDIDDHPNINAAKYLARTGKIHLCISNPCFELWGILHIKQQDAFIDRHQLQRSLHDVMPKYHHDNNPVLDYDLIRYNYIVAKERAIEICERRRDAGREGYNPSTDVYKLLDYIIANSKSA
jgi:hypothetical protein